MAGGSESEEAGQVDRCFWKGRWGGHWKSKDCETGSRPAVAIFHVWVACKQIDR